MEKIEILKEQGKYTFVDISQKLAYEANLVRNFGLKYTQEGYRILTKKLDKFKSYVTKVNKTGRFR